MSLKNILLGLEFFLLCVVLPTIIIVYRFADNMFYFLWGAALVCMVIHFFTSFKGWKELWHWEAVNWTNMKPILIRWVICSVGMLFIMVGIDYFTPEDPDRLFNIFHRRPDIIPWLLVAYPILSALPQEFIFCTYFFNRFKPFFPTQKIMIIASAVVFAYAHVLFINLVAPVLSFIAGIIFARTYAETRSLALVTIEHGLYGNVLFLVGLGWYFWGGAVGRDY